MGIKELGYLIFGSADKGGWLTLANDIVGLEVSRNDEEALYLKMDERDFRFAIVPDSSDRLIAAGFEIATKEVFNAYRKNLEDKGLKLTAGTQEECRLRKVKEFFWLTDPDGNRAEIFWGPISSFIPFRSPLGVSGFVTGALGMGHVVLPVTDLDAAQEFWADNLGFGLSDILTMDFGGHQIQINFNHCGNARQHSVALARMPSSNGCVHFMLELPTMADVGRALDRVQEKGLRMVMTLGQHLNDECISFYFRSPNGFMVELGWDGVIKDWDKHTVFETTIPSLWGHKYVENA